MELLSNATKLLFPAAALATVAKTVSSFSYYSVRAVVDPTDAVAVSAVGEIPALPALNYMRQIMMADQCGRYILQVQPTIGDRLLQEARQMGEGTFGHRYAAYMDYNQFTPSGRMAVRFISDPLLAYIMTRYRQCHDFLHTCTDCGRTVQEEVAVKLLEYQHTTLPLGVLAVPGGSWHLTRDQRGEMRKYWNWAKINAPCNVHGKKPIPFYLNHVWEDMLELPMEEVRKITGITPLPEYLAELEQEQEDVKRLREL